MGAKSKRSIFTVMGLALVLVIGLSACGSSGGEDTAVSGTDLKIVKSEVTQTAKFYPYKSGDTKMEVLAVKASDGSIRTALNTCQVCNNSGRGYYVQEGDELVCQNCGNRFQIDQVEVVKGGCNPVPVMSENKKEDDSNITISKTFLDENKGLFENWKTE